MNESGCPSCNKSTAEVNERERITEGLKVNFECSNCGHLWDVVF